MQWSIFKRASLTFLLLFFVLLAYPLGFWYLYPHALYDGFFQKFSFWVAPTVWFGEVVFGFEFDLSNLNELWDSKFEHSRITLIFLVSLILSIPLTFYKPIKSLTNKLVLLMLRTFLRFHVGFTMMAMGLSKIFMNQFGSLAFGSLDRPLGNYHPVTLMWTFMAYSPMYNVAVGLIQFVGGFLLLFRKTALLGALICLSVLANIVLLNIAYGVTLKIIALGLFLASLTIVLYDYQSLINLLVRGSKPHTPYSSSLRHELPYQQIFHKLKWLIITFVTVMIFHEAITDRNQRIKHVNSTPLKAKFVVESLIVNGDTLKEKNTETDYWEYLRMVPYNGNQMLGIVIPKKNTIWYECKTDTLKKSILILSDTLSSEKNQLHYHQTSEGQMIFQGQLSGDSIWVKTKIVTLDSYPVYSRKYKWIYDL